MSHRYVANPRTIHKNQNRAAVSGGAIAGGSIVILVALIAALYGVSRTVKEAGDIATSAPRTTGQGAAVPARSGLPR